MKKTAILPVFCLILLSFCTGKTDKPITDGQPAPDSATVEVTEIIDTVPKEIIIEKELLYDQHTLEDTYPYKDTTRGVPVGKDKGAPNLARIHPERTGHLVDPPELQE